MRMPHTPYHWTVVALIAAAFLLALSEAHGQPAGPPQGGIGLQGRDAALPVRKDIGKPKPAKEIAPPKDSSLVKDRRSAAKKGAHAARSTLRRSRTGVGEIESRRGEGG